jgi:hypothetical protein
MTDTKKQIKDLTLVPIFNLSIGECGYTVNNGNFHIRRNWQPKSVQEVEFRELKAAMNEAGVRQLFESFNKELNRFEDGELLIKNDDIREKLGLSPMGRYVYDNEQVKDLLLNGNIKTFEDVLENCPNVTLEAIIQTAIDLSLNDMNKITLIKSYSGKDILPIIQEKKESEIGEKSRKTENNTAEQETTSRRKKGV